MKKVIILIKIIILVRSRVKEYQFYIILICTNLLILTLHINKLNYGMFYFLSQIRHYLILI